MRFSAAAHLPKMNSPCRRCGQPFEHPTRRFTVCPACRRAVSRSAKKRWKKQARETIRSIAPDQDDDWFLKRLCIRSAREVGEICGLSRDQVLAIERRAIRKLRENLADLEEIRHLSSGDTQTVGDRRSGLDLIDFQMSVGEWWALAEHFRDLGKEVESRECVSQIMRFQRNIRGYLSHFVMEA